MACKGVFSKHEIGRYNDNGHHRIEFSTDYQLANANAIYQQEVIRMKVASSRPDHLPAMSMAKSSELSLLVK